MPGVPFSKACELCKKRRVKCDERKPSCSQCLRISKECPGYRHEAKFIDDGARFQKQPIPVAGPSRTAGPSPPRHATRVSPLDESREVERPFGPIFPTDEVRLGFELLSMTHLSVMHCGRVHGLLEAPFDGIAISRLLSKGEVVPSYISYIPERFGNSRVLDSAVDCLFTAAGIVATASISGRQHVLFRKYGIALSLLRDAIEDPRDCMTADVLAAVSLLSALECLLASQLTAWITHQKGIYQLIERRGVERYKTDFERQMLIASIGSIFTIALRESHPCFLEEPQWQEVIFSRPEDSRIAEWTDSWDSLPIMCFIPRLLADCRVIVRGQVPPDSDRIEALAKAAQSLRLKFLDLADRYGWIAGRYSPVLAPRDPKDHFRVFCDHDDQRAANFGNFVSGLLIIHRILIAIRPSMQWLEQKSRVRALDIQYLHSFLKSQEQLRAVWLVHSERVALAVLLTSDYWSSPRDPLNPSACDPDMPDGGRIIDQWKFDAFDDILCAKKVDAPLMFYYPKSRNQAQPAPSFWN